MCVVFGANANANAYTDFANLINSSHRSPGYTGGTAHDNTGKGGLRCKALEPFPRLALVGEVKGYTILGLELWIRYSEGQ